MLSRSVTAFAITSCLASVGCALFDSGSPWKDGNYELSWIDDPKQVTLSYRDSSTSSEPIIESQVFAVGSNADYIVAKQHPGGDKTKTNFYAVARFHTSAPFQGRHQVIGPMTAAEFAAKSTELALPKFSKTLQALE